MGDETLNLGVGGIFNIIKKGWVWVAEAAEAAYPAKLEGKERSTTSYGSPLGDVKVHYQEQQELDKGELLQPLILKITKQNPDGSTKTWEEEFGRVHISLHERLREDARIEEAIQQSELTRTRSRLSTKQLYTKPGIQRVIDNCAEELIIERLPEADPSRYETETGKDLAELIKLGGTIVSGVAQEYALEQLHFSTDPDDEGNFTIARRTTYDQSITLTSKRTNQQYRFSSTNKGQKTATITINNLPETRPLTPEQIQKEAENKKLIHPTQLTKELEELTTKKTFYTTGPFEDRKKQQMRDQTISYLCQYLDQEMSPLSRGTHKQPPSVKEVVVRQKRDKGEQPLYNKRGEPQLQIIYQARFTVQHDPNETDQTVSGHSQIEENLSKPTPFTATVTIDITPNITSKTNYQPGTLDELPKGGTAYTIKGYKTEGIKIEITE